MTPLSYHSSNLSLIALQTMRLQVPVITIIIIFYITSHEFVRILYGLLKQSKR